MTILERIQSYLENGGFFNPEMMEHEKVGRLLLDIRDSILPRPIETAPKDGTKILGWCDHAAWTVICFADVRGWRDEAGYKVYPLVWIPLPPAQ